MNINGTCIDYEWNVNEMYFNTLNWIMSGVFLAISGLKIRFPPKSMCFQPLPKSVLAQEHLCVQASRCKITCATRHPFGKVSVCKKCPCIDVFLCRNHLCVRLFVCKRFCVKVALCEKILIQKHMYLSKSSPV